MTFLPGPLADAGDAIAEAILDAIEQEPLDDRPALMRALRDGECRVTRRPGEVIVDVLTRRIVVTLVPVTRPRLDA